MGAQLASRTEFDHRVRPRGYEPRTYSARFAALGLLALGVWTGCRDLGTENPGPPNFTAGTAGTAGNAGSSEEAGASSGGDAGASEGGAAGDSSGAGKGGGGAPASAGNAGNAGATGNAGAAGNAGGAVSFDTNGPQEILSPPCISYGEAQPALHVSRGLTSGLAVNVAANGGPYGLYETQPIYNIIALRFQQSSAPNSPWSAWLCFDPVPNPNRLAANNLSNSTPELFATTVTGKLYVRNSFNLAGGWGAWEPMNLPRSDTRVVDVAASASLDDQGFVYILDKQGTVFVRHHESSVFNSKFVPWSALPGANPQAVSVCAGHRSDDRQQAFVLSKSGHVFSSIQKTADAESSFEPFEDFGEKSTPALEDIECGYMGGALTVFGYRSDITTQVTTLWFRQSDGATWHPWVLENPLLPPEKPLKAFAVGSRGSEAATVFGEDELYRTYSHVVGSEVWKMF